VLIVSVPLDGREIAYALPLGALKDTSLRSLAEAVSARKVMFDARKETGPASPIPMSPVSVALPILRLLEMRLLRDCESMLKTERPSIGVSFSHIAPVELLGAKAILDE
jgi:hypothetical protein